MTDWEKFLKSALDDIAAALANPSYADDLVVRAALLARQDQLTKWLSEA